jgi:hypothetical protein
MDLSSSPSNSTINSVVEVGQVAELSPGEDTIDAHKEPTPSTSGAAISNEMEFDQIFEDSSSFSSESSLDSDYDNLDAEADDEQSDWYGSSPTKEFLEGHHHHHTHHSGHHHHHHHHKHHHHSHQRQGSNPMPVPRNPFAMITASSGERSERSSSLSASCSSSIIWRKKRRSQLQQ